MKTNSQRILEREIYTKHAFLVIYFVFLCTAKDHLKFDKTYKSIYSSDLRFKKENISTSMAAFLDLSIVIENSKFKTQLCGKRDSFPFSIVCMPHLDGNILLNIYYAFIGSKNLIVILKISKIIILDSNTFSTLSNNLLKRMKKEGTKQGFTISVLNKIFDKDLMFSRFLQTQQITSSNIF